MVAGGAVNYSWTPATGLNTTNGSTVTASPSSTTTYTVTGTSSGCTNTASVTVSINLDSVKITPYNPSINYGENVTLTAVTNSTFGGITYSWSPSAGLSSVSGSSVIASPLATTNYTVTATYASGCSNTSMVTVYVKTGTPGDVKCGYRFSYSTSPWSAISGGTTIAVGKNLSGQTIDENF